MIQHDMKIFNLMRLYSKTLKGYFSGIEVAKVGFGWELSEELKSKYYPCTNCGSCGLRYSIIKAFPYDRKNTSTGDFTMCPSCKNKS